MCVLVSEMTSHSTVSSKVCSGRHKKNVRINDPFTGIHGWPTCGFSSQMPYKAGIVLVSRRHHDIIVLGHSWQYNPCKSLRLIMSNYYGYNFTQIQAYDVEKPLNISSKYTIYRYIRYKRSHNIKVGSCWYQTWHIWHGANMQVFSIMSTQLRQFPR